MTPRPAALRGGAQLGYASGMKMAAVLMLVLGAVSSCDELCEDVLVVEILEGDGIEESYSCVGLPEECVGVTDPCTHTPCREALEDLCEYAFDRISCFDDGVAIEIECQRGRGATETWRGR